MQNHIYQTKSTLFNCMQHKNKHGGSLNRLRYLRFIISYWQEIIQSNKPNTIKLNWIRSHQPVSQFQPKVLTKSEYNHWHSWKQKRNLLKLKGVINQNLQTFGSGSKKGSRAWREDREGMAAGDGKREEERWGWAAYLGGPACLNVPIVEELTVIC